MRQVARQASLDPGDGIELVEGGRDETSQETAAVGLSRSRCDEGARRPAPRGETCPSRWSRKPAVASFLSPDAAGTARGGHHSRLDQLDRRMARMERDLGISVETLAVFIRFWLTSNPPLPEPAQIAARAKAGERYEAFVTALGRRLAQGAEARPGNCGRHPSARRRGLDH